MTSERLVLPSDLTMSPLHTLSAQLQATLGGDRDDVVLTRPKHRRRGLVVNAETARLLEFFRTPITVPEAVLLHAVRITADPMQVLTEAYPVLRQLREARYLVSPDDAPLTANHPLLPPGSSLGRWHVEHALQTFDDSDVYRATDGVQRAAVKVVRPRAPAQTYRMLRRERDVLEVLQQRGVGAPQVLDAALDATTDSTDEGTAWLALSWVPGRTADAVAAHLRRTDGPASATLFRLCHAVLSAYVELHAAGLLHGDVHPRNLLVSDDGSVTLVDFALAAVLDGTGPGICRERGGIGWAFEPELAQSGIRGGGDVPVTAAAEQFSLAAVCFHLLTGEHHLNLPVDRLTMFEQIVATDSRRLSDVVNGGPLEFADAAFSRALARDPADRFPHIGDLAAAVEAQAVALEAVAEVVDLPAQNMLHRLTVTPSRQEFDQFPAPQSTLSHGAAGVAIALLRLAQLQADPHLVAAADNWSALALTSQLDPAYFNPALKVTPETVTLSSLYHSATGIHLADALVAHAVGDFDRAVQATRRFLSAAGPPDGDLELVNGEAGLLVGGTLLAWALRTPSTLPTRQSVLEWLRPRTARLAESAMATLSSGMPPLGLAHGLAGPVLAVSEAEAVAHDAVAGSAVWLASALAAQLEQRPVTTWPVSPELAHSWCNGTAGAALALAAAARHTADERCLSTACQLGRHAAGYRGSNGSLCCGAAGIGYVLLYLHRLTGDSEWLRAAQRMARHARQHAQLGGSHPHSLHKGALGPVLLAEDVEHPERVWFPGLMAEVPWT